MTGVTQLALSVKARPSGTGEPLLRLAEPVKVEVGVMPVTGVSPTPMACWMDSMVKS